jgi:hypothetical protein
MVCDEDESPEVQKVVIRKYTRALFSLCDRIWNVDCAAVEL